MPALDAGELDLHYRPLLDGPRWRIGVVRAALNLDIQIERDLDGRTACLVGDLRVLRARRSGSKRFGPYLVAQRVPVHGDDVPGQAKPFVGESRIPCP